MYGVVVFHYRWNKKLQQGQIMYKMVGQKCNGNCASDWFELPLWYPEEAQKVRCLFRVVPHNIYVMLELQ